jgi:hypothetical protein
MHPCVFANFWATLLGHAGIRFFVFLSISTQITRLDNMFGTGINLKENALLVTIFVLRKRAELDVPL